MVMGAVPAEVMAGQRGLAHRVMRQVERDVRAIPAPLRGLAEGEGAVQPTDKIQDNNAARQVAVAALRET